VIAASLIKIGRTKELCVESTLFSICKRIVLYSELFNTRLRTIQLTRCMFVKAGSGVFLCFWSNIQRVVYNTKFFKCYIDVSYSSKDIFMLFILLIQRAQSLLSNSK